MLIFNLTNNITFSVCFNIHERRFRLRNVAIDDYFYAKDLLIPFVGLFTLIINKK